MIRNRVLHRIAKIVCLVGLTIGSLVSLLYIFTNIRIIVSGDFMAYASPASGFFHSFFNISMYLYVIGMTIFSYFYFLTKKVDGRRVLYWICQIGLLLVVTTHIAFNKLSFASGIEGYLTVAYHIFLTLGIAGAILVFLSEPKAE